MLKRLVALLNHFALFELMDYPCTHETIQNSDVLDVNNAVLLTELVQSNPEAFT